MALRFRVFRGLGVWSGPVAFGFRKGSSCTSFQTDSTVDLGASALILRRREARIERFYPWGFGCRVWGTWGCGPMSPDPTSPGFRAQVASPTSDDEQIAASGLTA